MLKPITGSLAALLFLGATTSVAAKDMLVAISHHNTLHLVDLDSHMVVKSYPIPGRGPATVHSVTPTGKISYVLTIAGGSIAGMDLETGEQVFRADMSYDDVRTISALGAMTVSTSGKEVFVFQARTRLKPAEYEILDTRIAVYNTADGLDARPVRTFPANRGIMLLIPSPDDSKIHAFGWDVYTYDSQSGELLETYPVRSWKRENYSQPDWITQWPAINASGIFRTLLYSARTDMSPEDPQAYVTTMLTFDIATGKATIKDVERGGPIIFSAATNPRRKNEVYAVYTQLSKIDARKGEIVKRVTLPHTYYAINTSSDGEEIYVGGTMGDIGIYLTKDLSHIGNIAIPGGADQSLGLIRLIQW